MIYSIGGFILERIINLVFYGEYWDNSVLVGPYQPLYGSGVVLTILFGEFVLPKIKASTTIKTIVFIVAAIFFTALSEATTGYSYQWLTGIHLWDYGQFFPCSLEYICVIPTSLFGVLSYLVVKYLHPIVKRYLDVTPTWLFSYLSTLFTIDIIYTLIRILT